MQLGLQELQQGRRRLEQSLHDFRRAALDRGLRDHRRGDRVLGVCPELSPQGLGEGTELLGGVELDIEAAMDEFPDQGRAGVDVARRGHGGEDDASHGRHHIT